MTTNTRITTLLTEHPVVLFMKGTQYFPQCGFSARAISILEHFGIEPHTVDVLADPEIRAGIKSYSNWPTIPQLYVKGELVGGSDILMEMVDSGELAQLFAEKLGHPAPATA